MKTIFYFLLTISLFSCEDYLEVKPDKKLVVVSDFKEAQSLLNHFLFNMGYPGYSEVASDDYYLETADWQAAGTIAEQNAYIWNPDVFNASSRNDWSFAYEKVYYANLVIEGIEQGKITGNSETARNDLLGQAYFHRASSFYSLLQLFSKQWNTSTSLTDLGIPLRLTPDFNSKIERATVSESYKQLLTDLTKAINLLNMQTTIKTRPDKQAALALMARVLLTMGDYEQALNYCNEALNLRDELLDFNELNSGLAFPFTPLNKEVVFHSTLNTPRVLYAPALKMEKEVMDLYRENDLRKSLYFMTNNDNSKSFKGSYNGSFVLFNGLTISELYLIKAECLVRTGAEPEARAVLNHFMKYRFDNTKELPVLPNEDLLSEVLNERRRELLFRGLRWTDLKRLNNSQQFSKTIERKVGIEIFTLSPNSEGYVFKIPEDVIRLSGIEQN